MTPEEQVRALLDDARASVLDIEHRDRIITDAGGSTVTRVYTVTITRPRRAATAEDWAEYD